MWHIWAVMVPARSLQFPESRPPNQPGLERPDEKEVGIQS
jgi:hypothetical protein